MERKILEMILCDENETDRRQSRELAEQYLNRHGYAACIREMDSCRAVLAYLKENTPDLALLEPRMCARCCGHAAGICVASQIRKKSRHCVIIFLSGSDTGAARSYEVGALSYLRKPVQRERLWEVFDRAVRDLRREMAILVTSMRQEVRVLLGDILYIETETAARKRVIHTAAQGDIKTYQTLRTLREMLPREHFVQISRFEIVPVGRIARLTNSEVWLQSGIRLRVSSRMAADVRRVYEFFQAKRQKRNR